MDYKKLHNHILQEHDLFLFEDQIKEIVDIVLEMDDQKLFNHMYDEHDLLLLQSQNREIVDIVLEMHNENPEKCTASIERQYKEKGNQLDQVYGAIKEPSNNDQMKTAMQEMFEELYAHSYEIPIGLLAKCEELMAKEKQQIKDAYNEGNMDSIYYEGTDAVDAIKSEQYYNETYGNPDRV